MVNTVSTASPSAVPPGAAQLRVAIIGTGMIGRVHLRAARNAGAHVIGVLGSSPERSAVAASSWSADTGYHSFEQLLHDRPDVVHVCTPNDTHLSYGLALARAGIHMIVEKPIATNVSAAQELADAVADSSVIACVPFVYRFHPIIREIRARRRAGALGDVLVVHGSYLQDWLLSPNASTWRVDSIAGGPSRAFADIGSHWADLAEFVSGERFESVTSSMTVAHPTRPEPSGTSFDQPKDAGDRIAVSTEDIAVATFRTERGVLANTVVSQVSGGRKNRLWLEIDGSAGSAVFDQEQPEHAWFGSEHGSAIVRRGEPPLSAEQARMNLVPAGHSQGWLDAFAAFCVDAYAAVRGSEPEGLPTIQDGLRSMRIVDAVLRSAKSADWTTI